MIIHSRAQPRALARPVRSGPGLRQAVASPPPAFWGPQARSQPRQPPDAALAEFDQTGRIPQGFLHLAGPLLYLRVEIEHAL